MELPNRKSRQVDIKAHLKEISHLQISYWGLPYFISIQNLRKDILFWKYMY